MCVRTVFDRHVQLVGDLRRGQVGGQIAQDAGLGLGERLASGGRGRGRGRRGHGALACAPCPRLCPRRSASRLEDLGDHGGVRGALPGVALEQTRRRGAAGTEDARRRARRDRARARRARAGAGRVAQRVPGDRLQQEGLDRPDRVIPHSGAEPSTTGASATVAACGSSWASRSAASAMRISSASLAALRPARPGRCPRAPISPSRTKACSESARTTSPAARGVTSSPASRSAARKPASASCVHGRDASSRSPRAGVQLAPRPARPRAERPRSAVATTLPPRAGPGRA